MKIQVTLKINDKEYVIIVPVPVGAGFESSLVNWLKLVGITKYTIVNMFSTFNEETDKSHFMKKLLEDNVYDAAMAVNTMINFVCKNSETIKTLVINTSEPYKEVLSILIQRNASAFKCDVALDTNYDKSKEGYVGGISASLISVCKHSMVTDRGSFKLLKQTTTLADRIRDIKFPWEDGGIKSDKCVLAGVNMLPLVPDLDVFHTMGPSVERASMIQYPWVLSKPPHLKQSVPEDMSNPAKSNDTRDYLNSILGKAGLNYNFINSCKDKTKSKIKVVVLDFNDDWKLLDMIRADRKLIDAVKSVCHAKKLTLSFSNIPEIAKSNEANAYYANQVNGIVRNDLEELFTDCEMAGGLDLLRMSYSHYFNITCGAGRTYIEPISPELDVEYVSPDDLLEKISAAIDEHNNDGVKDTGPKNLLSLDIWALSDYNNCINTGGIGSVMSNLHVNIRSLTDLIEDKTNHSCLLLSYGKLVLVNDDVHYSRDDIPNGSSNNDRIFQDIENAMVAMLIVIMSDELKAYLKYSTSTDAVPLNTVSVSTVRVTPTYIEATKTELK